MKKTLAVIATLMLAACSDAPSAERALDNLGFKDVKVTGYRIWGCGEEYTFHTGFEAVNPNGKIVTGVVCSGWLRGSTVKFD